MFVLNNPSQLNVGYVVTNVKCNGESNGSIDITASGGTPPYTYLWNDGVTTEDRNNLLAGRYNVTVTDKNGCSENTTTITVNQPSKLNVTYTATKVTCFGGNDGSINLTVTGGTPPYTFIWNDGVTTEDRDNLVANFYGVKVTDANGCSQTLKIHVHTPPHVGATYTTTPATSNKICDGSVTITGTGGRPPYTYIWQDNYNGGTRNNLCPGKYYVCVIDKANCVDTIKVIVPKATAPAGRSESPAYTFTLSPNPTKGLVQLAIHSTINENATVNLYQSNSGKLLFTTTIKLYDGLVNKQLNLSGLPGGVYELQLLTSVNSQVAKLIIE